MAEIEFELCNGEKKASTNDRTFHWIEFRLAMCNESYYLDLIDQKLRSCNDGFCLFIMILIFRELHGHFSTRILYYLF